MYRTKHNELIKWKISNPRKPLIFLGARQVGKTYLLKEFGRKEYKQVAYINFERPGAPKNLFEVDFDADRIFTVLNAYCNLKIDAENTLIIFDEIQEAPKGITSLKYLYEDAPQYHIIAAGSLLGVGIHPGESFPVGKVDFMKLYPMSFYEFILAMQETGIAELLEKKDLANLNFFNKKLINYLRYYLYIGGMPEVVQDFALNRDWQNVRKIQNQIITSYRNDFSKHAPNEILPRINMVWDSIPAQLSKENRKFIYGVIKEGARAKDFEMAIQWLTDAGLLHKVYRILKPGGIFITQQVGELNNREISKFLLGVYPNSTDEGLNLDKVLLQAKDAGMKALDQGEDFPKTYFYDIGAFVYYAKIIEWEFSGFSVEKCFDKLIELQSKLEKNGYVEILEHRYLLVAKKE